MARKHRFKPEEVAQALREVKGGVFHAAERLGCSYQLIYDYRDKFPIVAEALKTERGKVVDTAELSLYQAVLRGEGWAVSLTLKTIGKDRGYVEKQEVDNTVHIDVQEDMQKARERIGKVLKQTGERLIERFEPDHPKS